ncbi:MAG: gentisate 1,2-dioxygenase, partial [Comamonadaceae bacterium]
MNKSLPKPAAASAERRAYYERIRALHLSPLWESLHALVPREPATPCVPALWRYADIRPFL